MQEEHTHFWCQVNDDASQTMLMDNYGFEKKFPISALGGGHVRLHSRAKGHCGRRDEAEYMKTIFVVVYMCWCTGAPFEGDWNIFLLNIHIYSPVRIRLDKSLFM